MKYILKHIIKYFFLFALIQASLFAERFKFKFNVGETEKISSIVKEDVYVDGFFSHSSEIVNRIISNVIQTKNDDGKNTAFYSCTFMTSEKTDDGRFVWGREYPTLFWRNEAGHYSIGEQYFMPILRDIPIFPEKDINIGQSWKAQASEAYDFSSVFGINVPVITSFEVEYRYAKKEKKKNKELHIIEAEYEKEYQVPAKFITLNMKKKMNAWPVETKVKSKQKIAFDIEKGNINYYDEEFSILLTLNNGSTIEYKGESHAEVSEIIGGEKKENNEQIKTDIENLKLANTSVKQTEKGLKIIIENIQFEVNSATLQDSEKEKLASIAEILKKYGNGDILIEGHTVFSSTIARQKELSEQRAKVVANYLIDKGVRDESHIFTRGLGGDFPIVPNTTEENKARNRRVEITIME